MTTMTTNFGVQELNDQEVNSISGGNPIIIGIIAVGAVAGALVAIEQAGEAVGKAIYYATH